MIEKKNGFQQSFSCWNPLKLFYRSITPSEQNIRIYFIITALRIDSYTVPDSPRALTLTK